VKLNSFLKNYNFNYLFKFDNLILKARFKSLNQQQIVKISEFGLGKLFNVKFKCQFI